MKRFGASVLLLSLLASSTNAHTDGIWNPQAGQIQDNQGIDSIPPSSGTSCAATNGQVDFSFCSNAVYVAMIL